jgi:hypothetical protein
LVGADQQHKADPASVSQLIRVPRAPDPLPAPSQLYNLREDPNEIVDLAARHPDRAHRMLCELETWFEDVEAERRRFAETMVRL